MSIPDYQTLMLPVLKSAVNGEVRVSDVIAQLADEFQLTEAERAELLPSGRITLFANRVHWAKTYLKQAGLIEQNRRAHFKLTDRGKQALNSGIARIDNRYLSQFPEFLSFKTRSRADSDGKVDSDEITAPAAEASDTPDELMRKAHAQIMGELREELLERLVASSPTFFEQIIIQLLVKNGVRWFSGSCWPCNRAIRGWWC